MARCRRYALLGAHPVEVDAADRSTGEFFDAFDAVVELDDGHLVVVGLRTSGYIDTAPEPAWPDGYRPLPVTLDFSARRFYDFNEILWLGPDPRSCLIWSNAVGLRTDAIDHLMTARPGSVLLEGPDQLGLPRPDELGIDVPDDLTWRDVEQRAAARTDG